MIYLKKIQLEEAGGTIIDNFGIVPNSNSSFDYYLNTYPCNMVQNNSYTVILPQSLQGITNNKIQIQYNNGSPEVIRNFQQSPSPAIDYRYDFSTNFSTNLTVINEIPIIATSSYKLREDSGKIDLYFKDQTSWQTAKFVDTFNNKSTFDNIGLEDETFGKYLFFLNKDADVDLSGGLYITDGTITYDWENSYEEGTTTNETGYNIYCDMEIQTNTINTLYSYLKIKMKKLYNYNISDNLLLVSILDAVDGVYTVKAYEIIIDNLNIKNYSASTYVKLIESDVDSMILYNVDRNQKQTFTVFDNCVNTSLNPIYRFSEFAKENMYNNCSITHLEEGSKKYLSPIGKVDSIINIGSYAFGLMKDTKQPFSYYEDIYDKFITYYPVVSLYNKNMCFNNVASTLYVDQLICQTLERNVIEDQYIIADRAKLQGVPFSVGLYIPLALDYFNYKTGSMWQDSYSFNNSLDSKYDSNISEQTIDTYCKVLIDNVREYNKINVNNKTVWVSYNANNRFISIECNLSTLPNIVDWYTDTPIMNMEYDGQLIYGCSNSLSGCSYDIFQYEQLERLYSINRPFTDVTHKSNIYSIELVNTGLNDNLSNENIKTQIQNSVERIIKDYLKEVTPANTNLWKIIWRGL